MKSLKAYFKSLEVKVGIIISGISLLAGSSKILLAEAQGMSANAQNQAATAEEKISSIEITGSITSINGLTQANVQATEKITVSAEAVAQTAVLLEQLVGTIKVVKTDSSSLQ